MGLLTSSRYVEGLLVFKEIIHSNKPFQLAITVDYLTIIRDERPQILEQLT